MKTSILLCFVATVTFGGIPTIHPLPLVLDGTKAAVGQFPYLVSIQMLEEGEYYHHCGGSIINKRWILTAAHCISDGEIETELNEVQILAGTNRLDKGGVRYNVSKIIVHANYNPDNSQNDIALLKVDKNIKFKKLISSIPLASSEPPANATVFFGGWGESTDPGYATNDLQFLKLYAVPTMMCNEYFPCFEIFKNNTCALPAKSEAGLCFGDGGGPLVYNKKVVGVLSWGKECGGPYPAVFTKVPSFNDWINKKIRQ